MRRILIILLSILPIACGYTVVRRPPVQHVRPHPAQPSLMPLPNRLPTSTERAKIDNGLLRALDDYETLLATGDSPASAFGCFSKGTLIFPTSYPVLLFLVRSRVPSTQLADLFHSLGLSPDHVTDASSANTSVVDAQPRLIWYIVELSDIDSVYARPQKNQRHLAY